MCMRSAVYIKPTMCYKANSFTLTEGGFVLYINGRLGPLITISYCGWYEDIFAVYRTTVTIKYCWITSINYRPGPINRGLRMRRECRERFSGDRGLAIPTCIRARASRVPWCIPGSLTSSCLWSRWRRKRSWHFWWMRNPQFYISCKGPMDQLDEKKIQQDIKTTM